VLDVELLQKRVEAG
jgi:signal transduction histidine kinase